MTQMSGHMSCVVAAGMPRATQLEYPGDHSMQVGKRIKAGDDVQKACCDDRRATLVDQGQKHPVEGWDFEQGDVWCG
jgi:hypothetical protein